MEKTLLGLGGTKVVVQNDGYGPLILKRGRLITPKQVKSKKGQAHQCHLNSSLEYLRQYPAYQIATGYTLGENGLWYRHSWLLAPNDVIVETTVNWQLYYGVALDETETARFVLDEVAPRLPGLKGLDAEGQRP